METCLPKTGECDVIIAACLFSAWAWLSAGCPEASVQLAVQMWHDPQMLKAKLSPMNWMVICSLTCPDHPANP